MRKRLFIAIVLALSSVLAFQAEGKNLRVLYWNIQNGMWSDQGNNYDNFVEFVKGEDPDICVWCEAESRYFTDSVKQDFILFQPFQSNEANIKRISEKLWSSLIICLFLFMAKGFYIFLFDNYNIVIIGKLSKHFYL